MFNILRVIFGGVELEAGGYHAEGFVCPRLVVVASAWSRHRTPKSTRGALFFHIANTVNTPLIKLLKPTLQAYFTLSIQLDPGEYSKKLSVGWI